MVEIRMLPATAAEDAALMERITDLINEVYAVARTGCGSRARPVRPSTRSPS
jgi:hypothetical protein